MSLVFVLAGCALPPSQEFAAQAATPSAEPTFTPLPTITPRPAPSPLPTITPLPTAIPTPTDLPAPRYDLVLLGGTLIDATGAPPVENTAIAILGREIAKIGLADTLIYSNDTPVLDVTGHTIMPGFINAHVHITGLNDDDLRRWTRAGVTTIRDLAGPLDERIESRTRIQESNDPSLPRLLVAGPILTVAGGYPVAVKDDTLRVEGLILNTPEEARAAVKMLAEHGVDLIKLAVSGRTDVHWNELTDAQIAAITETAHAYGLRVSAHVDRQVALRRAVLNGIDDSAHSPRDRIADDLIEIMVEKGVTMTPTISVYEDLARMRGNEIDWHKIVQPIMYDNVRRFVAAGGTLVLGDDFGGVPNMPVGMPMAELLHWQAAGLTPMQIIIASTCGSAKALGMEDQIGTIEEGKIADVLIVEGNPLIDLRALARPAYVIHDGQFVE